MTLPTLQRGERRQFRELRALAHGPRAGGGAGVGTQGCCTSMLASPSSISPSLGASSLPAGCSPSNWAGPVILSHLLVWRDHPSWSSPCTRPLCSLLVLPLGILPSPSCCWAARPLSWFSQTPVSSATVTTAPLSTRLSFSHPPSLCSHAPLPGRPSRTVFLKPAISSALPPP